MHTYQDITRQIGDQWVAALNRTEDAVTTVADNVQDSLPTLNVPRIPVPQQVTRLNDALVGRLPKPGEILLANFELTERLLAAQKEVALKVLAAATSGADVPSAPDQTPAK